MLLKFSPQITEHAKDGKGFLIMEPVLSEKELGNKCKLFSKVTLKPGCSMGYHKHEGNGEVYYILSGEGLYNDNGELKKIGAGDITWCPDGSAHGLENTGSVDLVFMALIINK